MNKFIALLPTLARIFLGLLFTVFGLNGFLNFIPVPPPSEAGGAFLGALAATGYMFPLIKSFEIVAGVMLLANRFVPLALLFLSPIVVNIFFLHAVLDAPASLPMPIMIVLVTAYLGWAYRNVFGAVLAAKTQPAAAQATAESSTQLANA